MGDEIIYGQKSFTFRIKLPLMKCLKIWKKNALYG